MPQIGNHTYDELTIGQSARYSKRITEEDVRAFAALSGDFNPVHLDPDYAAGTPFGERIAHGMLTGAVISAALAMVLPGPGSVYLGQSLRFRRPVKIGDTVTVELEVTEKRDRQRRVTLDCRAMNQAGELVASGVAEVAAPAERLVVDAPEVPAG